MAIYLEGWQRLAYTDTCRVFRLKAFSAEKPTFELCYAGPCRFQERVGDDSMRAGASVPGGSYRLDLPAGVTCPAGSWVKRTTTERVGWFATQGPVAQHPARGGRRSNTARAVVVPQPRSPVNEATTPNASDYANLGGGA